jgi:prepilin-type processing-associated H-X9-DG protein
MELLVVISVIALLLAILSPSITQVRSSARQSLCTKNLHHWGTAFTNRMTDVTIQKVPPVMPRSWTHYLLSYVGGDQTLLRCTEETRQFQDAGGADLNLIEKMGQCFALATYSGGSFLYNMPMEENPVTKKIGSGNSFDLSFEDQRDSTGTKEASYSDHSFANPIMHVEITGETITISVKGGGGGYIWNLTGPDGKVLIPSVMKTSPIGTSVTVPAWTSAMSSYGMNSIAKYFRGGMNYITLMDYQDTLAYVVDDNHAQDTWQTDTAGKPVFARHFGKLNVMYADGRVEPLVSFDDINPTGKPTISDNLWGHQTQLNQPTGTVLP